MRKLKPGDIFEFAVPEGFGYALYTHHHALMGSLIRVAQARFKVRPTHLDKIFSSIDSSPVFFAVQTAVKRKYLVYIGNYPIPESLKPFPIFRIGIQDYESGLVQPLTAWDGERELEDGLIKNIESLPQSRIISFPLLVDEVSTTALR